MIRLAILAGKGESSGSTKGADSIFVVHLVLLPLDFGIVPVFLVPSFGAKATGFFVVNFVVLVLDFGIFPVFLVPSFDAKATGFFVVHFISHSTTGVYFSITSPIRRSSVTAPIAKTITLCWV